MPAIKEILIELGSYSVAEFTDGAVSLIHVCLKVKANASLRLEWITRECTWCYERPDERLVAFLEFYMASNGGKYEKYGL